MNRSPVFRTLLICLILLVGLTAAYGQAANLLTNPGFENPFEAVEGGLSMVAQGWTPWSLATDQNVEPEYYLASDTVNGMAPPRIHSGDDAQQYFSFFAPHIAGVYQQVTGVAVGDQLSFSIYAYLWSSSGDDTSVSDGSGDVTVEVGIDPNGGADPTSNSIVWSDPASNYDQYAQYAITAAAAGDTVTVFVRSTVTQVAMNNTVYLDDAELIVTGSAAPAATDTVSDAATDEALPVVTDEATEVVVEVTVVPTEAVIAATEVVTEAPTEVITEVAVTEELIVVTVEVTEATEVVATETATVEVLEVTEAATVEVSVEILPTDVPTELPTEVPPTDVPTLASPTEVPTEAPPTEIPTDAPPTSTPLPSPTLDTTVFPLMFSYTVVRGDTVGQLATRYGSTVEAIIIANQLAADARIFETQILLIPVVVMPLPTEPPTATPIPSQTPLPTFTPIPSSTPLPPPTLVPTLVPSATEVPVQVLPAQVTNPTATVQIATTYAVQYGDSLSTIAVRFGVLTRDLARVNNIVNPNLIYIGQVLQIPVSGNPTPVPLPTAVPTSVPSATAIVVVPAPTQAQPNPSVYTVMPGDNLYRISIRFNVSIRALIEINGIADASRIFVGQLLILP